MIHPQSFLLLHNSDKSREEQYSCVYIQEGFSSFSLTYLITSLSLLCRKESLLYCAEKGLSLTHVKPDDAETEAATAEVKFDLRGPKYLLI